MTKVENIFMKEVASPHKPSGHYRILVSLLLTKSKISIILIRLSKVLEINLKGRTKSDLACQDGHCQCLK